MQAVIKNAYNIKEKTFVLVEGDLITKGLKLTINGTTMEVVNTHPGKIQTLEMNNADVKLLNGCKDTQVRFSHQIDNNIIKIDNRYIHDDNLKSKLSRQNFVFLIFVSPLLLVAGIALFKHLFYAMALWLVSYTIFSNVIAFKYNAIYIPANSQLPFPFIPRPIVMNAKESKRHIWFNNCLWILLALLLIYLARFVPM